MSAITMQSTECPVSHLHGFARPRPASANNNIARAWRAGAVRSPSFFPSTHWQDRHVLVGCRQRTSTSSQTSALHRTAMTMASQKTPLNAQAPSTAPLRGAKTESAQAMQHLGTRRTHHSRKEQSVKDSWRPATQMACSSGSKRHHATEPPGYSSSTESSALQPPCDALSLGS